MPDHPVHARRRAEPAGRGKKSPHRLARVCGWRRNCRGQEGEMAARLGGHVLSDPYCLCPNR
jgi:hypothetical protein